MLALLLRQLLLLIQYKLHRSILLLSVSQAVTHRPHLLLNLDNFLSQALLLHISIPYLVLKLLFLFVVALGQLLV